MRNQRTPKHAIPDRACSAATTKEPSGALISRGMAERAKEGLLSGCAPVGYMNARQGKQVQAMPDPEKAPFIEEAFMRAGTGESLRHIATALNTEGFRSRNEKPIGVSALWKILTNPFYMGIIEHKKTRHTGQHQPLISQALFTVVQDVLARRCRNPRTKVNKAREG